MFYNKKTFVTNNNLRILMRIFLLLFILFNSGQVFSDSFEVVEDYNYEAQESNSEDYTNRDGKVVTINNKSYFSAVIDAGPIPNSFHRLTEKRLVVTDGTPYGTHIVVGLEDTNLEGRLIVFGRVGNKLLVILRNTDSSMIELWELSIENNKAVLIHELARTGGLTYFYHNAELEANSEGKAVITSKGARAIIIYDSTDSSIEVVNTTDVLTDSTRTSFVSGGYIYYQKTLSDSQYEIYRLHLVNKEIEFVANSRIGWGHITVNGKIYYINLQATGEYAIYGIDVSNKIITKESDSFNFGPSQSASLFILNDYIVFNAVDSLFVKKISSNRFSKLELPQNVTLQRNNIDLSFKTYLIGGKYYVEAENLNNNSFVILETDLETYINTALEFSQDPFTVTDYVKYTAVKDNIIYLVTDTDSNPRDYNVGYGTTKAYSWNPSEANLNLIWEKDNLNGVNPITEKRKDIVFAYTIEKGSEPWFLDFVTGNSTQLADFNSDFRTSGSSMSLFSKSNTRAILVFAPVAFREAWDYFGFALGQLNGYQRPQTNKLDTSRRDKFVGMDARYDYFTGYNYYATEFPQLVISAYDSTIGSVVELATPSVRGLEGPSEHGRASPVQHVGVTKMLKGQIPFIYKEEWPEYKKAPTYIYQWAIDRDKKFKVNSVYTEVIPLDTHLLLTGWNYEMEQQQFGVFKDDKEIITFFIQCEGQVNCASIGRYIFNDMEHLVIATDSPTPADTGNFNKAYYINLKENSNLISIPLNNFQYSTYPRESPILAVENSGILFLKDNYEGEIFKFDFSTNSLVDLPLEGRSGKKMFNKTGNYYVGLSGWGTSTGPAIFILDKELNFIKKKLYKDVLIELGYDSQYADIGNYLGCAYGVCYLQGNNSFGENEGLFQVKFDITLNQFVLMKNDIQLREPLFSLKDAIFSKGVTAAFGLELYKHTTSGLDSDGDGMWDSYELAYDFDPHNGSDGAEDLDSDGLTNFQEFQYGTYPNNSNSDGDEVIDGGEVSLGYDPLEYDTHFYDEDEDGLSFRQEFESGTDYLNPDTDGDGYLDGEDTFPLDANEIADFDGDGIGDNADIDDDNDGMPDEWEEQYALNPIDSSDRDTDFDSDGISNYQEYVNGTDPTVANNNSGGGDNSPPSSDSGGGGPIPIWLLIYLLAYIGIRKYYR